MREAESQWYTTPQLEYATVEQAREHLLTTQEFVHGLHGNQPKLTQLNDLAQRLQGQAEPKTKSGIAAEMDEINKLWSKINADANGKMAQLKVR